MVGKQNGIAPGSISTRMCLRSLAVCAAVLMSGMSAGAMAEPVSIPEPPNKGVVLKEDDIALRKQLDELVAKQLETPGINEQIVSAGEERTVYCNVCHGKDGNARKTGVPNLAGQNPAYLIDQIQRFSDGRRYDKAMASLAGSFTDEEKVLLALYYSKMEPVPAPVEDAERWARGQKVYSKGCAQCHGDDGKGEKGYARLASQKQSYVMKMLREFGASTGRRSNPWMTIVSQSLNDKEMEDVSYYISTMK